jgi:hypothetical protein
VGLIAYQLRSYSPRLGRWLNRDPIEEEGGVNLYAFCSNDGVAITDSLGQAVFLVLAGLESPRHTIFPRQQKIMGDAMRTALSALTKLNSVTEKQYDCLKKKRRVFFNRQLYSGTLTDYRNLLRHELKSQVKTCPNYFDSVWSVWTMSSQVSKDWDYLVYLAHGGNGAPWRLRTVVKFLDGTYDQHTALNYVSYYMRPSMGSKFIISCYQTWNGRGDISHVESISHVLPSATIIPYGPKAVIAYTTHKVIKGVH